MALLFTSKSPSRGDVSGGGDFVGLGLKEEEDAQPLFFFFIPVRTAHLYHHILYVFSTFALLCRPWALFLLSLCALSALIAFPILYPIWLWSTTCIRRRTSPTRCRETAATDPYYHYDTATSGLLLGVLTTTAMLLITVISFMVATVVLWTVGGGR